MPNEVSAAFISFVQLERMNASSTKPIDLPAVFDRIDRQRSSRVRMPGFPDTQLVRRTNYRAPATASLRTCPSRQNTRMIGHRNALRYRHFVSPCAVPSVAAATCEF